MPAALTNAFLGGCLIGIAVTLMLYFNGRITGNSGIIGGLWTLPANRAWWRLAYVAGLVLGTAAYMLLMGRPEYDLAAPSWSVIVAGFLVGYGTRLGSGCTAGHGICGLARFSLRSLVATGIFMLTAVGTVTLMRLVATMGGG